MNNCKTIQQWLPWYVSGQLSAFKRQRMAEHISECACCQKELAEVIQLQHRVTSDADASATPASRVWDAISMEIGEESKAQIDLGSFLVGLKVGIAAGNKKNPIQGDLRVLGRKVRIIGKQKKGA